MLILSPKSKRFKCCMYFPELSVQPIDSLLLFGSIHALHFKSSILNIWRQFLSKNHKKGKSYSIRLQPTVLLNSVNNDSMPTLFVKHFDMSKLFQILWRWGNATSSKHSSFFAMHIAHVYHPSPTLREFEKVCLYRNAWQNLW